MKKVQIFLVLINVFIFASLYGQNTMNDAFAEYENTTHYHNGHELWVNDTICYFSGESGDWIPTHRLVVLSRDGLGQELETALEYFDEDSQRWQTRIKSLKTYYYFQDTHFLKNSRTLVWSQSRGKWIETGSKSYNNTGSLIELTLKNWDEAKEMVLDGVSSVYEYDKKGQLKLTLERKWDPYRNSWVNDKQYNNSKRGEEDIEVIENWDAQNNTWVISSKTKTKADEMGRVVSHEQEVFDKSGRNKVLTNSTQSVFNELGSLSEMVRIKDLGYRQNGMKENKAYDEHGRLIESTIYVMDPASGEWINDTRTSIDYPYETETRTVIKTKWQTAEAEWKNVSKEYFNYRGDDLYNKGFQVWDDHRFEWMHRSLEEFEYYNGKLVSSIKKEWDSQKNDWNNLTMQQYEFNSFGKSFEVLYDWNEHTDSWENIHQFNWEYDESGNIIEYQMLDANSGNWQINERATFGWNMFAVSKTENKANYTIEVFPNPTKGVLHIKSVAGSLSRIAILDQYGQLLEAISLDQRSTTIDISHLPSGNYFVECKTGIQKNTFKVVKL